MTITIPVSNPACDTILWARMKYHAALGSHGIENLWTQYALALNSIRVRREIIKTDERFRNLSTTEQNAVFNKIIGPYPTFQGLVGRTGS